MVRSNALSGLLFLRLRSIELFASHDLATLSRLISRHCEPSEDRVSRDEGRNEASEDDDGILVRRDVLDPVKSLLVLLMRAGFGFMLFMLE